MSASFIPRVVRAGVPRRMPDATIGEFVSNGIVFLFAVIPALSSAFSATLPVMPFAKTSTSIRWLSVPPETRRQPSPWSAFASAAAFATICFWYAFHSGVSASLKDTAFAAITCMSGPPCTPGNTALSISFAQLSRQRTMPPRGPRSVLCVVVVTNSQCGTGLGWRPAATRPAMCAMSAITSAPDASAAARTAAKSIVLG